jgi:hypothetical protein
MFTELCMLKNGRVYFFVKHTLVSDPSNTIEQNICGVVPEIEQPTEAFAFATYNC